MLTNKERIKIISRIEIKLRDVINSRIRNSETDDDKKKNEGKLWENFYIKKQIDRRKTEGGRFNCDVDDCTRAMVYSFLSSQNEWDKVEKNIDKIEEVFLTFDSEQILKQDPEKLAGKLKGGDLNLGTLSTKMQMEALIYNIKKLKDIQLKYEYVSDFYDEIIESKSGLEGYKSLVKRLAIRTAKSDDKMEQMGIALAAEYLRNLGYDIPKPDRHILRILGPKILGEHTSSNYESDKLKIEVFDIIDEYAKATNKSRAEIDYLFWAYCANKYGEVCTKISPACGDCAIKEFCKKGKRINQNNVSSKCPITYDKIKP